MSARDRLASYIGYEPGENDEKFTALLDAVVAERDAEIIAWLGKKAKEYRSDPERRESAGDAIERMASKISRGAVRAAAGQAPAPEPRRRLDDDGRCHHCRRTPERCDATGCGGRRDPAPQPEGGAS